MASNALRFLELEPGHPLDCTCDILDKHSAALHYVQYMLDRTAGMFEYSGLPDTIPPLILEVMLQTYGTILIAPHNSQLYSFRAGWGGPPDVYYRSTIATVANPGLGISQMYRIANHLSPYDHTEWETLPAGIKIMNDARCVGMIPMYSRYATQLSENDVSIRSAQINSRQQTAIVAADGPEIESARAYQKALIAGELAVIGKRPFLEGINVVETSQTGRIVMDLVELHQYIKASWFNDVGLNSNFNMKRSYISPTEAEAANDTMAPLIDDMLECRRLGFEAVNREFGTNITVEKGSAWKSPTITPSIDLSGGTEHDEEPTENNESQDQETEQTENQEPEEGEQDE